MKITSAMELIAASRIVRAQARVEASQPYTQKLTEVIANVGAASGGASHPLLESRDVRTAGVIAITSDRGLAGGYNTNVIRLAEARLIELKRENVPVRLYVVGNKAQSYFRYRGYQIEHAFLGVTDAPGYGDARAIANTAMNEFAEGAVDTLEAYTTLYVSALTQTAARWPVLPIEPPEATKGDAGDAPKAGYNYEPSAEEILERLLPLYLRQTIYSIFAESVASEHLARRMAMSESVLYRKQRVAINEVARALADLEQNGAIPAQSEDHSTEPVPQAAP